MGPIAELDPAPAPVPLSVPVHAPELRVERRVAPADDLRRLLAAVADGLAAAAPWLPTRLLYHGAGGARFAQVAADPRYRLARREVALLDRVAADVVGSRPIEHVVELGGGVSAKLVTLLRALGGRDVVVSSFDIDHAGVTSALRGLPQRVDGVRSIEAIVGDLEHDLAPIPRHGRRLVVLLGSTYGNFDRDGRAALLRAVAGSSRPGDTVLLGVDCNRAGRDQLGAYRSAAVARFNLGGWTELGALVGAPLHDGQVEHHVTWDDEQALACVQLVPRVAVSLQVEGVDLRVSAGVPITTASSRKFRPGDVDAELLDAGFEQPRWWFDGAATHGLVLATCSA